MKQLFPPQHVMGFLFSLLLSLVALVTVLFDLSFTAGMTILVVTALVQAGLQLFLFMHVKENAESKTLYMNILYALFVGLVTIFGTLFTMHWGYMVK
ncbi:cytochrome aa3 quinol oxidase subunit IV [Sporosarcina jeotgali]|uniref:Quinol oxidase subunit 4 n=1 Tax=Sporosarcina jeotgali TaxID=3020056 RepID=A0ABZ0KXH8_9BACL|nr:cytochrome aa3 quinol oxidase subunit IV [Sporosarcina sp. B2O-1]WOV85102.1 cytochrome aa3 quinol oxidase subunit IV [Sporosarcina sp. B2O-1]